MRPNDCASAVLGDLVNLVSQISEIEICQWIDLLTIDLDCAVVRIDVDIRVLFLDNNSKLIGVTLIPDGIRSE